MLTVHEFARIVERKSRISIEDMVLTMNGIVIEDLNETQTISSIGITSSTASVSVVCD